MTRASARLAAWEHTAWQGAPEGQEPDHADGVARAGIDLSVIVPTYRDGARIYAHLCQLDAALAQVPYTYEIVAVSDGNADATEREIARFARERGHAQAYHYPTNQGKGYALTYGVARSRGRLVTFIDGDGDIEPQQIITYVKAIEASGAPIVIGSKRHPASQVCYPGPRRLYSWGYQMLLNLLFALEVQDTQVGLKVFRREVLAAVLPRIAVKRYAFDLELLVVARHLGYRQVIEAPVTIRERFSSSVNLGAIRDMLLDTLAIYCRKNVLHSYDRAPRVPLSEVPLLVPSLDVPRRRSG